MDKLANRTLVTPTLMQVISHQALFHKRFMIQISLHL